MLVGEEVEIPFTHRLLGVFKTPVIRQRPADPQKTAPLVLEVNSVRDSVQQRMQQIPLLSQALIGRELLSFGRFLRYWRRWVSGLRDRYIRLQRGFWLHRRSP